MKTYGAIIEDAIFAEFGFVDCFTEISAEGIECVRGETETVEEYIANNGDCTLRAITLQEHEELIAKWKATEIKKAGVSEITEREWNTGFNMHSLESWKDTDGFAYFHESEHIAFDLVDWYGRVGERYFRLVDEDRIGKEALFKRFMAFVQVRNSLAEAYIKSLEEAVFEAECVLGDMDTALQKGYIEPARKVVFSAASAARKKRKNVLAN
jgi:hypothetical protein